MIRSISDYPDLMTVEEAANYLRVSRTLGYQLARQYRITGGEAGLPVVQLGRCLRVPRDELAELVLGTAWRRSVDERATARLVQPGR
jgi:excisionase family DNA binding protein